MAVVGSAAAVVDRAERGSPDSLDPHPAASATRPRSSVFVVVCLGAEARLRAARVRARFTVPLRHFGRLPKRSATLAPCWCRYKGARASFGTRSYCGVTRLQNRGSRFRVLPVPRSWGTDPGRLEALRSRGQYRQTSCKHPDPGPTHNAGSGAKAADLERQAALASAGQLIWRGSPTHVPQRGSPPARIARQDFLVYVGTNAEEPRCG